MELRDLVAPGRAAVVTSECQQGVIGTHAVFPELAKEAAGAVPAMASLARAARAVGVPVVHCTVTHLDSGFGFNHNARLFRAAERSGVRLTGLATEVLPELDGDGPRPDTVLTRHHGLGPMHDTGLDTLLRNMGAQTVIVLGVSVNVAITNLVMDAVNREYDVVLPRDAVAGVPRAYAEEMIDNTLALLATVTTSGEVQRAWQG